MLAAKISLRSDTGDFVIHQKIDGSYQRLIDSVRAILATKKQTILVVLHMQNRDTIFITLDRCGFHLASSFCVVYLSRDLTPSPSSCLK